MSILRTPDDRFANLSGYAFAPNYATIREDALGELRLHYVDEGPRDGPVVLLMHGEPTWSYLYRRMIPPLVAAGARVIAPDLIGFGRSDKPSERDDYSYARHVAWMSRWLTQLNLRDVTLFCQDWGGLIGLRLVATFPERFARVATSNTFLPTGDAPPSEAFLRWRQFSQNVPEFDCGSIVSAATAREVADDVKAAYNAPYPDESYKAGARAFPLLVPVSPDDPEAGPNKAAWAALERFDKPFLTLFGDSDPVTRGGDRAFQARIPGAKSQPHAVIERAGHFSQEDAGEELAAHVVAFMGLSKKPQPVLDRAEAGA